MTDNANVYHVPALLNESVDALNIRDNGVYVDATFGGGGHSREILARLNSGAKLVAFDRDGDVLPNLPNDSRFLFVGNNFRFMQNFLRYHGIKKVDGIIADLGVSSHHFDHCERGFSFRFPEAPIDMRMGQQSATMASALLNAASQDKLQQIFCEYGELKQARKIAQTIVAARADKQFQTVGNLIDCLARIIPRHEENQTFPKVFQALRIEVNREMTALKHFLEQTTALLSPKGRLAVISYHSLEDRMVKNFMKTGNTEGQTVKDFYGNEITPFVLITKKAIVPDDGEIRRNSRSRSAKLRTAEKKSCHDE
ncbi:MAG: 16S rRNA (cytosine(1402)-N(4))-methyltransferase RsmH [Prevotellaceae bacterium]|jgi:16S rRNA (cytosine1402-N4)-methyltransferase|nr:16S rRNA (cytosine(1402)-N(4))-methyltransferase RsmH [Prevotellaceae bacterium]